MKILVVKPYLPLPPHQGSRRVTLGLLDALTTAHDVSYLTMLENRAEAPLVDALQSRGVEVRAIPMPNRRSPAHRAAYRVRNDLSAIVTGYPRDYYYSTPAEFADALERWTSETAFDVVLLEYWKLARLVPRVRSGRVVVLAHDAEFVRRRLESDLVGGSAWRTWRLARESRREIETLGRCDTVLALTDEDRRAFLDAFGPTYQGEVRVLPVGVPFDPPPSDSEPAPNVVGFLGSFKGRFNVDAIEFLLDEIWPRVRERVGDATLEIAGGDAPEDLLARSGAGDVRFLGYVDDLVRFIQRTSVFVVPLRFAGGLRIRLLEALTIGAAVVATPVAVSGLMLKAGEHHLEADSPEGLAESILHLLTHPDEARRLRTAGRELASRRYGPEATRLRTLSLFDELRVGHPAA